MQILLGWLGRILAYKAIFKLIEVTGTVCDMTYILQTSHINSGNCFQQNPGICVELGNSNTCSDMNNVYTMQMYLLAKLSPSFSAEKLKSHM